MSKKTAIIIILAVTFITIGGLLFFYLNFYSAYTTTPAATEDTESGFGSIVTNTSLTPEGTESVTNSDLETTENNSAGFSAQAVLQQLTSLPVGGAVSFLRGQDLFVRYVERGTGHIFEIKLGEGETQRISNTTIPKISEVLWGKNGVNFILRYNKEGERIDSFSATIKPRVSNPEEGELQGTFLPPNIKTLTVSPNGEQIFFLLDDNSGSRGITSNFDGTRRLEIFSSPLKEWQVNWPKTGILTLTTAPSSGVPGFQFNLNSSTGSLTKVISGIAGLTILPSPIATKTLIGQNERGGISLKLFDQNSKQISNLGVSTFPEKCVWSLKNSAVVYCGVPKFLPPLNFPDAWYQGSVLFDDEIWRIDTSTGETNLLSVQLGATSSQALDITNPTLSPNEDYLFFTDKQSLTLWALRLGSSY